MNFTVGDTDQVEAGNNITLIAQQGGTGGNVSDGTVSGSNATYNYIDFGKPHKLSDGAVVTWTGSTGGGLTQNKEYRNNFV